MRPLCYIFTLATAVLPSQIAHAEALVTRARAIVLAALSASLGGVAAAGCKIADSRTSLVGVISSGAVLGVALILDALRPTARDPVAVAVEQLGQQLRTEMEALHDRVDAIEVKLVGRPSGEGSAADRTGNHRAL